jgi:hypothetical protein
MPEIDRCALKQRAWAIFRETYKYPLIKFKDIGRKCCAWALRRAWEEARESAQIAAIPMQVRAECIETLQGLIGRPPISNTARHGARRLPPIATKSVNCRQTEGGLSIQSV